MSELDDNDKINYKPIGKTVINIDYILQNLFDEKVYRVEKNILFSENDEEPFDFENMSLKESMRKPD